MSLAELERELAGVQDDLDTVNEALSLDPADPDAVEMKPLLLEQIKDMKARIAAASRREHSTADATPPPPPPDHSLPTRRASPDAAPPPPNSEEARVVFNTGDSVMAKYSADKQWYAATVIGKTGSSTDPVYTVKFTGYADKETKRKHEVRALDSRKRKIDTPVVASPAPPPPPVSKAVQNGTVISAAPSVDPSLVQKREPSKVSDGPTRLAPAPKKLKGNKTLEKAKSSWNDWQKSGPKKPVLGTASKKLGKDSQFRTPDLPNAKVGFTGSGKPMSKDQARTKWNYGPEEPEAD